MVKQKGLFIVVDGIDGSGKGTVVKSLANYLFDKDKKNHVFLTREPYISKYYAEIRKILKESDDPRKHALQMTRLYIGDRRAHVKWIKKELRDGHIVISDRYKYATEVYQQTQGIPLKSLIKMHKGMPIPDLVIFLDIPAKVAMNRVTTDYVKYGRAHLEVFERVAFQAVLRQKYLELSKIHSQKYPEKENIVVINGNRTKEKVFVSVKKAVDKLFPRV